VSRDYAKLLRHARIRRGECPECGEVTCECSSKTAGLLTETEVRAAAARYKAAEPLLYQEDCDKFYAMLKRKLEQDKTAAVDPSIQATGLDSAANGNDVQPELLRNPFAGTPQAADFENGYQKAQSLGHLQINQAQPDQIDAWSCEGTAWRTGFAQAARSMGCGNIASQLDPSGKVAVMLPFIPAGINEKTAGALGTLAGTLTGAGLGAGVGALHGASDLIGTPDFQDAHHMADQGALDSEINAAHPHLMDQAMHDVLGQGAAGMGIGAAAGGTLGHLATKEHHMGGQMPQMGAYKMAATEYFASR